MSDKFRVSILALFIIPLVALSGGGGGTIGQINDGVVDAIEDATAAIVAASKTDYFVEVARGNVAGQTELHKFGRNPDIDTGGFETIWNGGGSYTGHDATAAEIVEIFSSSANDDVAGTGALTLKVFGLDTDYLEINETVVLTGATPVDTVNMYIRLNRMKVLSAGSGGMNDGTLTARQKTTTANVFAVMPIGYNQTMIAAYTIPANKDGLTMTWFATLSGKTTSNCNVRIRIREFGEVFSVKEEIAIIAAGSSANQRSYKVPKDSLTPKADIFIEADASANNTAVSAGFDILLIDQ